MIECFWYILASCWPGWGRDGAGGPFGAYTELISKNGYDTVTVPLVNAAVLLALHAILEAAPVN